MKIYRTENEDLATWEPKGEGFDIVVSEKSDYFADPIGANRVAKIPVAYVETPDEDFTCELSVDAELPNTFDAAGFFLRCSPSWSMKFVAERSPTGEVLAVSVLTTDFSDDCNGPETEMPVNLRVSVIGPTLALHIRLKDGTWRLVRYTRLPDRSSLELGLFAQSPTADGVRAHFSRPVIRTETLENIRNGR